MSAGTHQGSTKRKGTNASGSAKRSKSGPSVKHAPITLGQIDAVILSGVANERSATEADLRAVASKNQTGFVESILEKVSGYSPRGALDEQVKAGCGMTYAALQRRLEQKFSVVVFNFVVSINFYHSKQKAL